MNARAREILLGLDIDIDVTQALGSYSVALQQMAAIARALEISSAKVLILDEPTSSLDVHETKQLFDVMRKLRDQGMGIIFITHFLDQVYEVADRITVLRNGKLVGTYQAASLPRMELIAAMIGRLLTEFDEMGRIKVESGKRIEGQALLAAKGLGRTGEIEPFDLTCMGEWSAWPACWARGAPKSPGCSGSTSLIMDRSRSGVNWSGVPPLAPRRGVGLCLKTARPPASWTT
jgi:simple sugar transport system ATP-binding protein